ncbi:helix-turn-helix domain-containing protein [Paenibacillus sp. L3-i20]|uniref:helix-turn-helix domain-containing protein n=1 Tax=Paenibacillus sp. L3-i20 TaxID=2905833 RepID=UPI001EDF3E58|nr:helix-turn-helix transcriptional regulator [Paenibacillus sp. L3-i20]
MADTLGSRIRRLRKKSGLTQEEIAAMLGKTRPAFTQYELDNNVPPSETLSHLASILKTSTDYLMGVSLSSQPADAEDRFVDQLDLSDSQLLTKFDLILDGEVLDKEQFKMAVAFLRTLKKSSE